MDKEELEKECLRSMKEFDLAWAEFFEDKPEPKNDEEDRKQQEEFYHWYNYLRKQSDTGKTPAEMYKETYGKEPPQNFPINSNEPSRIMNFEWDDYDEDDFEEEEIEGIDFNEKLNEAQEEAIVTATEIFEKSWKQIKQEVHGASKKEASKYSFILGFLSYMKILDKKAEQINKELKDMPKEDIEKMIDDFKKYEEERRKDE